MDVATLVNRNRELRKQAKDCYKQLSFQQASLRRQFVIAKYTCVHVGLVLRNEYQAAGLMRSVIDEVRRPLIIND